MSNEKKLPRSSMGNRMCQEYYAPLSLLRACGYSYEDLSRPRIAVINTYSEITLSSIVFSVQETDFYFS